MWNYTALTVSGFNKIIQTYYNHFKKPIIIYFGVNVEYKKIDEDNVQMLLQDFIHQINKIF